ncbi:MAG: hypothetical protein JNL19_09195 [Burkholderiales bacterium]|nr:hypothetical protein [Burkholderiales bacterium]
MPSRDGANAHRRRPRWLIALLLLAAAAGIGGGVLTLKRLAFPTPPASAIAAHPGVTASAIAMSGAQIQPRHPGMTPPGQPQDPLALAAASGDPKAQEALWAQRLARATEVLEHYREHTKYPFDSRPAREHGDQMYPNQPVREEGRLVNPGQKPAPNVRIIGSQERVYVAGGETVLFTVTAVDDTGAPLPLQVTRATALDPPKDGKPSQRNSINLPFNDEGSRGDVAAGDGMWSARLAPATQGFAGHFGVIRVELLLRVGEQTGFKFFDVFYTPEPPALWVGGVREAVEAGSLNFYLRADVIRPGRYVVTGRIDDAKGQPFALLNFNNELAKGTQDIKLNLFGKLLVDEKPAFPLTLRDVDGFLLIPDADPDRALMARREGKLHTSRSYPLSAFSEAEWDSEERRRYLAEYGRDVESARAHLEHVRRTMKP